ncbi:DUF234 domain-containing protein [Sulfurospirillum barnesii]|uniref:Putative helicase n=1 Tax=Sulfurospirillum barnesii (strain ATCC 700032 / DSM 10660 / SES-3) TaxID=760154 RepID=I3XZX6_SULBS|nr:DUF234 domain-containing protein [Sulfurospirillum barnesii]AFL69500.1 putative helicase [Sulfurospirillum barnesii SES-3]
MSHHPTLLAQFRSFYRQNALMDLERAIEYFSVFGGTHWSIDTTQPLLKLIEHKILKNYPYIHVDITKLTHSNKHVHAILSACATGDRRIFSSFKRARLSREEGNEALHTLLRSGLVEREYSLERPLREEDDNSDKLNFNAPFMRFWFAFVSPYYKSIKENDFSEVKKAFENHQHAFSSLIFIQLSQAFLQQSFIEDSIVEVGSYWDKNCEIDILAKTKSGKLIAGSCKYTNTKVKKSELSSLREKCALAEFEPDMLVIFSKSGFSAELKALKNETLKLFTCKSLKPLVESIHDKEILSCVGKKY